MPPAPSRVDPGADTPAETTGPAEPRDARLAQKRDRILDAARDICAEHGFEAARMDTIAARACVSKGTLYNFFASKEELFVAAVLRSYAELAEVHPLVFDRGAEPRDRVEALIESMAQAFSDVSREILIAHLAWSVVLTAPRARDQLFRALHDIYAGYKIGLRQILEAGIDRGRFRPELDIDTFSDTWIAIFDGLVYRSSFESDALPEFGRPETVRRSLHWLLEQILLPQDAPPPDAPPTPEE